LRIEGRSDRPAVVLVAGRELHLHPLGYRHLHFAEQRPDIAADRDIVVGAEETDRPGLRLTRGIRVQHRTGARIGCEIVGRAITAGITVVAVLRAEREADLAAG